MLVLAVMAEFVGDSVPRAAAWRAGGALDVRFRAPALPGERLAVCAALRCEMSGEMSGDPHGGYAQYELWCENEAGVRIVAGTARIPLEAFST